MPNQLIRTVTIDLPDDIDECAEIVSTTSKPWREMMDALAGLKTESKVEIVASRARPGPKPGTPARKRGTAAAAPPATLPLAPEPSGDLAA